ncbi:MAG: restriction endonuclease subunit S [Vulcanimicrobiaceae bacterium]
MPHGWTRTTLAGAADILDSMRVPINAREREKRHGPVPYYGATGQVGWIDAALFDEELLLLGEDGAPFLDPIKPKAYLIRGPAWVNNHAHVLRARSVTSNKFLCYYLNSLEFNDFVNGTTRLKLTQGAMRSIPVVLPSPSEQRRIVEVIEEQFSRLDAAEASLMRVEYRANALAEAAYRAVRSPRWPCVKLSTIARTTSGGTPSRRKSENFGGTVPWIKSGELGDSHVRVTAERISDRGLASSSAKLLKRGTLMMAMYGATVGKLGILDLESAATNQAVCAIEPHDAELIPFLWLCLRAMRHDLIDSAKGGAQPNISQGMIRDLMIPMPPPEERARLISEIALQVSACERVATAAVKGRLQIRRLQRAILEHAFSGRLVSQPLGEDSGSSAKGALDPARATRAPAKGNGAGPLRPKSEVTAW